jgi:protein-L-isoaspartate O-methyltransferase
MTADELPTSPDVSCDICREYLPAEHPVPRFFQIQMEAGATVGRDELESVYDSVHEYYDTFWVKEAGKPVEDLIDQLDLKGDEEILEAGCGTGFATALMAERLGESGRVTAVDISEGMLIEARKRIGSTGTDKIRFVQADALEALSERERFDIIFSSWVLGYIPLSPFFGAACNALKMGGRLAFVVHKENSPAEPLEIFGELVSRDPTILKKQVSFDFPRDMDHVREEIAAAGLTVEQVSDGKVVFVYDDPEQVLEHLLKSGAGTAFYDALDPARREGLEREFVEALRSRREAGEKYDVVHDYIMCIAE